jgi:hypothetical protein
MIFGFDLDLLRTFAAVVDSGGFTKAAERARTVFLICTHF